MKAKISEDEFAALLNIEGRYLEVFQEERKRLTQTDPPSWVCDFGWSAYVINPKSRKIFRASNFMKTRKGAVSNLYRKYYANSR
jgi:hypothetical protein